MPPLHLVVGFGEKLIKPKVLYAGSVGTEAKAALEGAGKKGHYEAHHFVNPERAKRIIFSENADPQGTK